MTTQFGYNLYEGGETDKAMMTEHIRRTQMPVLVIDSEPRALELAEISPYVISRHTSIDWRRDEGIAPIYWFDEAQYVEALLKKSPSKKTVKCVLNEPVTDNVEEARRLCNWLAGVGAILAQKGYRAVLGNFPVAFESQAFIRAGVFDQLIRVIAEYDTLLSYGGHNYTWGCLVTGWGVWTFKNLDPRISTDNPIADRTKWFARNQIISKNMWHMGHHLQVTNDRAMQIINRTIPNEVTEIGWAKVSDIADQDSTFYPYMDNLFASTAGDNGLDGAEALGNLWRSWWPHWTQAEAMAHQLNHAIRMYPENTKRVYYFSMGTYDRFGQNSIHNREFIEAVEHLIIGKEQTEAVIPIDETTRPVAEYPEYAEDDPRWKTVRVKAKDAKGANMRPIPNTIRTGIGVIPQSGAELKVMYEYFVQRVTEKGKIKTYQWMPVQFLGRTGWVRRDVVTIHSIE